jgi:hypothetical protein
MIRKHSESGTVEFLLDRDGAETPYLVGSWDGWEPPGIPKSGSTTHRRIDPWRTGWAARTRS